MFQKHKIEERRKTSKSNFSSLFKWEVCPEQGIEGFDSNFKFGPLWFSPVFWEVQFSLFCFLSFKRGILLVPNYKHLWIDIIIIITFCRVLWLKVCIITQNALLDMKPLGPSLTLVWPDMPRYILNLYMLMRSSKVHNFWHIIQQENSSQGCSVSLCYFCKLPTVLLDMNVFKGNRVRHCQETEERRGHWQSHREVTNLLSHLLCSVLDIFPLVYQNSPSRKWWHFSTEVIWQIDLWLWQNVNHDKIKLSIPWSYQQRLFPK